MNMAAKFNDGKSSITIACDLELELKHLLVKDADSHILAYIAYSDLVIIEDLVDSLPGIIGSTSALDIRIEVGDAILFKRIASIASKKKHSSYIPFSWATISFLSALVVMAIIILFKYHNLYSHLIAQSIPQSWDDNLGHYVASSFVKESTLCTNNQGQAALEKLVKKLIQASHKEASVSIKVIQNDKTVNAFAVPGNQIFVYSGLIKEAQSYEELAGVLAHEIGHLLKRHPTESLIQILSLNLIFKLISGGFGQMDYLLNASNVFMVLHYSRDHELEADTIAIGILNNVGIGGDGFLSFFMSQENREKDSQGKYYDAIKPVERFLSTHPLTADRAKFIKENSIKSSSPPKNIISKAEWKQIQNICNKQS